MKTLQSGRRIGLFASMLLVCGLVFALAACGGGEQGRQGGSGEIDPESTAPVQMTMAGASPQGYFRVLGESINSIVRDQYPGSSIAYEPGSPAGSLARVAQDEAQLAVAITPVEEVAALRGEGPFEELGSLEGEILGVMRIHEAQRMHSVMLRDFAEQHGIESFEDIAEKKPPLRVSINQQGNYQNVRIAEEIFESYGFTFDDIAEWGGEVFFESSGNGIELLRDRRTDMYFNGTFIPDSNLTDAERALDLVWVSMDESNLEEVANEFGLMTATVEPGEYEFIEEPQATILWQSDMITGPDVPAQDVYNVVKAVYENIDDMQAIHPEMEDFSGEMMVRVQDQLPLHPGAEQFYREQGLLDGGASTTGESTQ